MSFLWFLRKPLIFCTDHKILGCYAAVSVSVMKIPGKNSQSSFRSNKLLQFLITILTKRMIMYYTDEHI